MKITRTNIHYKSFWDTNPTKTVVTSDWGISFADILGECGIEGHSSKPKDKYWDVPSDLTPKEKLFVMGKNIDPSGRFYNICERCDVCGLERDGRSRTLRVVQQEYKTSVFWSDWYKPECAECEENCAMSQPMGDYKCVNCGVLYDSSKGDVGNGTWHTGVDYSILYDCHECNTKEQLVTQ